MRGRSRARKRIGSTWKAGLRHDFDFVAISIAPPSRDAGPYHMSSISSPPETVLVKEMPLLGEAGGRHGNIKGPGAEQEASASQSEAYDEPRGACSDDSGSSSLFSGPPGLRSTRPTRGSLRRQAD